MRPTISLCVILKNEERNLPGWLDSFVPLVDEVHLVDTGSTDKSLDIINDYCRNNKTKTEIYQHYFGWKNDFALARNFAFDQATCDYVLWADLDDLMSDQKAFIKWRDEVMHLADFWCATYHYAFHHETNKPICSFARERVIKRSLGLKWKYFVHEGIPATRPDGKPVNIAYATTWTINHMRTELDLKADRSRNLKLFESRLDSLEPRMQYYYGKELFENQQPIPALEWLLKASKEKDLEGHDRILCTQYAAMAAQMVGQWDKAIQIAHAGLQLHPNRAELFCLIGDSYLKKSQLPNAIPYFEAAMNCLKAPDNALVQGAIYQHSDSYTTYPVNQLARIYVNLGNIEKAREKLEFALKNFPNKESESILSETDKLSANLPLANSTQVLTRTDDILISCHPNGFYEWDEEIAKTRGIGGSETAVVHMARHLHNLTGRNVLIYNNVTKEKEIDGVFYKPTHKMNEYIGKNLPSVHIAWRHNMKLTNAPTYLWCHDLYVPGIEHATGYDKVLALSEFHKSYLINLFRVPEEKIIVTRNGIDPTRFETLLLKKERYRVCWSSSPDRGLDRAIRVMDRVIKNEPRAKFHIYYGFDNMLKMGKQKEVKELEAMINDRSWIVFHGNTEQKKLALDLAKTEVWLYPTNFLETFFIGGLEAQACGVYFVGREYGALPNTLAKWKEEGMADLLDHDCETDTEIDAYAQSVLIGFGKFTNREHACSMSVDPLSWESVAKEWIEFMGLVR